MNTEPRPKNPPGRCPQCGAILPPDAPDGLCPRCVMALNLKTETVLSGAPSSTLPPLPPEQISPHFPQLEILACLGRGGMGVVYKARQKTLNRLVALKLLAPERVNDPKFAERFAREAQALAALDHPHIVTIYDFGQAGGFYFLLMEFVDGVNLRQLFSQSRLSPREALAIVPPICEALQFAHDSGIVHRDIKPENILLDKKGQVKIADFGIAKMITDSPASDIEIKAVAPGELTEAGSTLGTPQYMAPEQIKNSAEVDHRADIYSLGVVFYQMLTGELPSDKIEPPSRKVQIDVRLDEVVLRALEKKPELRFQQASEVKTMVETIAGNSQPPKTSEPWSRAKTAAVAAVLILAACVAAVVAKVFFFQVKEDAYFKANYQHFQSLPDGLFIFRPTHFHTPRNGLDYSCENSSPTGEHVTWMMGRNRNFVQFITRLYNCRSNQVVWPAIMPEGGFDYLSTMLDSKAGERFGAAVKEKLGLELVPTNTPNGVVLVIATTPAVLVVKNHYATPPIVLSQAAFLDKFGSNDIAHATINLQGNASLLMPVNGTFFKTDNDGKLTKEEVPFVVPNAFFTQEMINKLVASGRVALGTSKTMRMNAVGIIVLSLIIGAIMFLLISGIIIYVVWRVVKMVKK